MCIDSFVISLALKKTLKTNNQSKKHEKKQSTVTKEAFFYINKTQSIFTEEGIRNSFWALQHRMIDMKN